MIHVAYGLHAAARAVIPGAHPRVQGDERGGLGCPLELPLPRTQRRGDLAAPSSSPSQRRDVS